MARSAETSQPDNEGGNPPEAAPDHSPMGRVKETAQEIPFEGGELANDREVVVSIEKGDPDAKSQQPGQSPTEHQLLGESEVLDVFPGAEPLVGETSGQEKTHGC